MHKEAILHIPDSAYAYAIDEKTIVLRVRAKKNDLTSCTVCYGDRVSRSKILPVTECSMEVVSSDSLFDYFECTIKNCYPRVCYYFILESKNEKLFFYSDDFYKNAERDRSEYYQFAFIRREDVVTVPNWAKSAIIYQIFPDSFATSEKLIVKGNSTDERCNGGTLKGITENIDYIKSLGANCLYINPIFKARSYHRYDTTDYYEIDEHIGTKEELKDLVKKCHSNGIRVLLDGVFNHSGIDFKPFKDVIENGEKSIYKDWFYKLEFPVKVETPPNYMAFAYEKKMPKLNTGNPEVEKYFIDVGTYWIKEADIDGWRLDVANEVNHGFWRNFRQAIKNAKSDAFLIGEIWEDSKEWLRGDQFDSTMNYKFINLSTDFFADGTKNSKQFGEKINAMLMRYATPISEVQMNLLDSHDVPRFLTKCGGSPEKLRLAMMFLLTFVGTPSIFYGDELLIDGLTESEYRRPMCWNPDSRQKDMKEYITKLCHIRTDNKAFTSGIFRIIDSGDDDVLMYERQADNQTFVVVINRGNSDWKINLPERLKGRKYEMMFSYKNENVIGAMSGNIIAFN